MYSDAPVDPPVLSLSTPEDVRGDPQPFAFFGLNPRTATLGDLRRRYYELAHVCHPDRGGSVEDMRFLHRTYRHVAYQMELAEQKRTEFETTFDAEAAASVEAEEELRIPRWGELMWELSPVSPRTIAKWVGGTDVFETLRPFIEGQLDQVLRDMSAGTCTEVRPEPFLALRDQYDRAVQLSTAQADACCNGDRQPDAPGDLLEGLEGWSDSFSSHGLVEEQASPEDVGQLLTHLTLDVPTSLEEAWLRRCEERTKEDDARNA